MPENPYAEIYASFQKQTENHELTVEHDIDGHRTLYVGEPGTGAWSWRVITSPFYLTIVGDIADGYTFTRTFDMLDFFGRGDRPNGYDDNAPSINPHYWAEKLTRGGRSSVKKYSQELAVQILTDLLDENEDLDLDERKAIIDKIAEHAALGEDHLRNWLSHKPQTEIFGQDAFWEYDFSEYTYDFVLACYAIVKTVSLYREQEPAADDFIIVDGGLVSNNPALPVFDMDVLDSNQEVDDIFDELIDLYQRVHAHGDQRRPVPQGLFECIPEIEELLKQATGENAQRLPQMLAEIQGKHQRRLEYAGRIE